EDDLENLRSPKTLPNNHRGNPIPNAPLFPLLPSVQIFLRCLLSSIDPSGSSCAANWTPIRRYAVTRRCIWLHHLNWRTTRTRTIGKPESRRRPYRISIAETQSPMRLCFLCCLLFKFSSLPFVEH